MLATYGPIPSGVTAVAVGWLDREHDYKRGAVEEAFVSRLFESCRTHAVARTRGMYVPSAYREQRRHLRPRLLSSAAVSR